MEEMINDSTRSTDGNRLVVRVVILYLEKTSNTRYDKSKAPPPAAKVRQFRYVHYLRVAPNFVPAKISKFLKLFQSNKICCIKHYLYNNLIKLLNYNIFYLIDEPILARGYAQIMYVRT